MEKQVHTPGLQQKKPVILPVLENKKLVLLLGLLMIFCFSFAQNSLILDIEITGNQNIDTELIRSMLTLEIGDMLDPEKAAKSINNLYQLGVFEDVLIEKENLAQGISLVVSVKEFPIVDKIEFSGNKKISTNKLLESIELKSGSYWSPFLQKEVEAAILAAYKEKGFHLAEVTFTEELSDENLVNVSIVVDENKKVTIKKIRIHGNKLVRANKLMGKMKTKKASLLRSGKFEKDKFEEDLTNVINYYNKTGFIDAHIVSWEQNLVDGNFVIDIYLFEGKEYYFGKVFVVGNQRFTENLIVQNFKFKEDEVFNLEKFNKQLGAVTSMYYEEGYIYANFDHELQKVGSKVNIQLNIQENTRAKVRKIQIKGNKKTKEKIIRRQLVISPGDYFQQSKVMRSQQNIYNMGFFEPDMYLDNPTIINQNGDVDLAINLNDKVSGTANGGVALNSQDGLVGQLAVSHNNLLGNSWQAAVKWEFGGSTQNFSLSFTNPYFQDTNTLVGFDIYLTTKEWDTYKVRTSGGSVKLGRPLSFLNYSRLVAGYSFYAKKYSILSGEEDNASQTLNDLDAAGWQNTSAVSLTFSRDSRDNVFFPTSGSNFILYSEFAGGPLQGDFNYFKQISQVSWFTNTVWKLALRTKWRFGYLTGYGGKEAPPDERFYLGGTGADGIRGYADRSIGPREGGLREMIFSCEYGAPIAGDQIVGLLFMDSGNCFDKLEEFNFWELKTGAGVGIRIRSPFGLIGFDYAHNFETKKWEPHFQFGTTF
ncbi:MAG: outer membrane protein assembly factor BamA [Candidatus Cloacimonadales bacterium]|nr:outer membrane protein assembly factor BamA [Candidatus Cloacimonadales bacterium]